MEPIRTFIVDDAPPLRRMLREILVSDGRFAVVGEAGDGAEAISMVSRPRPHLVILDAAMPKMDGLEALPFIRRAVPEARIVLLSGFMETYLEQASRQLGAASCIEKGLPGPELVKRLLAVMETPA